MIMDAIKGTIWHKYEVNPIDLIGRTVTIKVVKRDLRAEGDTIRLHQTLVHGTVQSVAEDRGSVFVKKDIELDDLLDATFDSSYPSVAITLTSGAAVRFDPERDAVAISW